MINVQEFVENLNTLTGLKFVHQNGNIEHNSEITREQSDICTKVWFDSRLLIREIEKEREIDSREQDIDLNDGWKIKQITSPASVENVRGFFTIPVNDIPETIADKLSAMAAKEQARINRLHRLKDTLNNQTGLNFQFDSTGKMLTAPLPESGEKPPRLIELSRQEMIDYVYLAQVSDIGIYDISERLARERPAVGAAVDTPPETTTLNMSAVARLKNPPSTGRPGVTPKSPEGMGKSTAS